MAKRSKKSSLKVNPYKAHAKDETEYGMEFIDLPGGITGGVARLAEAKVGTFARGKNQGEKFIYLAGIVVEPKVAVDTQKVWKDGNVQVVSTEEVEIKGQRTGMTLPLCDTTKANGSVVSADENIGRMLNELRKLGGEECTAEIENEGTLAQVLEILKEEGPFFKFSTTAGNPTAQYPIPRIWENWFGAKGLEDYEPEEEDDVDENKETEESDGPEKDDIPFDDSTPDLTALAEAADEVNEDDEATEAAEEAQRELEKLAESAGINAEKIDSWGGVADAITKASGGEPEDGDEDDPWVPKKEEVYKFKPPRARKAIEVMITAVFEKAETVTAKALESEKVYKAVPWSKLEDV